MRGIFSKDRLQFSLLEFSGGLGDLGTFIPLTVGMALVSGMDLTVILFWAGLFSIFAGLLFGLPVPIQPMKAIAAVAIAESLAPGEIAAAGIIVGAAVFLIGVTGLMKRVERLVPIAIVRGIQLGVGLKLGITGLRYISDTPFLAFDSTTTAVVLGLVTLIFSSVIKSRRLPAALMMLLCGITIVFINQPSTGVVSGIDYFQPGFPAFEVILPSATQWKTGLLSGSLAQFPLTILNSVIAICALSGDLFPARKIPLSKMALSVGMMNLIALPFGAMPMCHGSGGLAGQHYFGARTGGSVIMVGVLKIAVALLFGAGLIHFLSAFPLSVLGVMLLFAGLELALPARDQTERADYLITLITAVGIISLNTGAGFLLGAGSALVVHLVRKTRPKTP